MRQHYTLAVANYFEARPNQWVSYRELMQVGGQMAWRSRVSNCRRDFGMTIENKIERNADGVATSFYRYRPAVVPVQAGLFTQEGAR